MSRVSRIWGKGALGRGRSRGERGGGAGLRGGDRARGAGGQVGEMGGEGRASRGESCVLTQFHMQVCLLASLGCLTQSLELKELDYFVIQSQLYPWMTSGYLSHCYIPST